MSDQDTTAWRKRAERADDRIKELKSKLAAIRELHWEDEYGDCDDCGWPWPCPTFKRLGFDA